MLEVNLPSNRSNTISATDKHRFPQMKMRGLIFLLYPCLIRVHLWANCLTKASCYGDAFAVGKPEKIQLLVRLNFCAEGAEICATTMLVNALQDTQCERERITAFETRYGRRQPVFCRSKELS